jgi:hypothetical protein
MVQRTPGAYQGFPRASALRGLDTRPAFSALSLCSGCPFELKLLALVTQLHH